MKTARCVSFHVRVNSTNRFRSLRVWAGNDSGRQGWDLGGLLLYGGIGHISRSRRASEGMAQASPLPNHLWRRVAMKL